MPQLIIPVSSQGRHRSADVKTGSPEEFGKLIADELAMWSNVTRTAGIHTE
jgi:hypothetical protein